MEKLALRARFSTVISRSPKLARVFLFIPISHRGLGDYKFIFTESRGEYQLVITEPEATNC